MDRPRTRLSGPVLGTPDPISLAAFYSELLGWPIVEQESREADGHTEDWAKIRSPHTGYKIEFQYEPYFVAPVWPPVEGGQQMLSHLDVGVDDLEAGVAFAEARGASKAEHQPQEGLWVMRDPSGHLFCLFPDETSGRE